MPDPTIVEPRRKMEIARLSLTKLPPETHLDEVLARVCEVAADALEIDRVAVWLFVDNDSALRCVGVFERSKNEQRPRRSTRAIQADSSR